MDREELGGVEWCLRGGGGGRGIQKGWSTTVLERERFGISFIVISTGGKRKERWAENPLSMTIKSLAVVQIGFPKLITSFSFPLLSELLRTTVVGVAFPRARVMMPAAVNEWK